MRIFERQENLLYYKKPNFENILDLDPIYDAK